MASSWNLPPYEGDEPTALAYTPDRRWNPTPMPQAWLDAFDADTREDTIALAVESARRWARRTDLSPELRLRRIWQVITTALETT